MTSESLLVQAWDRDLTRAETEAAGWKVAAAVGAAATGPRRRVGVYAANSAATLVGYLGVVYAGCTVVPLNIHLSAEEVGYLVDLVDVELIVCDAATRERVADVVAERPTPILVLGEDFDPFVVPGSNEDPTPAAEPDVLVKAPLLFTSGTSGRPKAVEMPPAQFPGGVTLAAFRAWAATLRFAGPGPHLVCGPMYHAGPLQAVWLAAAGTPVLIPKKFDAGALLDLIEEYGVTTSLMVPTHLVRFLAAREERRAAGRPDADVSTWEHITLTGSLCPPDVKRAIIDWWGPVIYEGYGGTESGGICYISAEEWLVRPTSVGRARAGFRIVILDDDDHELPAGQDGRIYFEDLSGRGIEYLDNPEATAKVHVRPGVFTLGEIGHVDEEGYVYITDRDSEKIVSGGVNLYPAEAERVLLDHPDVEDAIVFGIRDREMGEKVVALVVPARGAEVDTEELIQLCVDRLSRMKAPRYIHLIDEMPRMAMGKAIRRKIRDEYEPIVSAEIEAAAHGGQVGAHV